LNFENSASSFGFEKRVDIYNDHMGKLHSNKLKLEEIEEMVKILAECDMVN
jgi:hypothetical protein